MAKCAGMTAATAALLTCLVLSLSVLPSCGWSRSLVERQSRQKRVWRHGAPQHDNEDSRHSSSPPLVSGLLQVSYDGAHFSGWSAANQQNDIEAPVRRLSSGRKRRKRSYGSLAAAGQTRSVERVLQVNLAKLYGNVDPSRIVVEGCSRTDKGVHAKCLVAQFYCLSERYDDEEDGDEIMSLSSSIPGKRMPHPRSSFDSSPCFTPLSIDLGKLMYCLNRMLPHNVKVRAVAKVPERKTMTDDDRPFHPTLDSVSKTYEYTFSVGPIHDPLTWRTVWHLEVDDFDYEEAERVARKLFVGRHNFAAFRGAPRGKDDKRRYDQESTVCTIFNSTISISSNDSTFPGVPLRTYSVSITGDRFLYKMVRFMIGSLVAVGTGRLSYDDVRHALESGSWEDNNGDRVQFTCAPAHGLVLTNVDYDLPIEWNTCTNRQSTLGG